MDTKKAVGKALLIVGPLSLVAWLAFSFFGIVFSTLLGDTGSVSSNLSNYYIPCAFMGVVLCGLVTLGGWVLTHPTTTANIQKPVGWLLLVFGTCGGVFSIVILFPPLLFLFVFMIIGGWLLISPLKIKKRRKRIHPNPPPPAERGETRPK